MRVSVAVGRVSAVVGRMSAVVARVIYCSRREVLDSSNHILKKVIGRYGFKCCKLETAAMHGEDRIY